MKSPADIWKEDLFDRQNEANLLIAYIESVYSRPNVREDSKAYTIAVDAGYGEGKTFFLRRLAEQLEQSHPVAFIDAWADDIADEPLTALAATLEHALAPWLKKSGEGRDRWNAFMGKAGAVAKIAAVGLAKRSVDLALGFGATTAISGVLDGTSDVLSEATTGAVEKAAEEVVDEAADAIRATPPGKMLAAQIAKFREGKAAIQQMKLSLAEIVQGLNDGDIKPPIVIIIDELDRCRPTYAVKMFEEIKHLFDVHGIVFVLGMHGQQLAHSVTGAYGPNFDGAAYLRRFLNRKYVLDEPNLYPLLQVLMHRLPSKERLFSPRPRSETFRLHGEQQVALIARYMSVYGVPARAAFEVVDILQTCLHLTSGRLHLPYLLPLIMGHITNLPPGSIPETRQPFGFSYGVGPSSLQDPQFVADRMRNLAVMPSEQFYTHYNQQDPVEYPEMAVAEGREADTDDRLEAIENYPRLLLKVGQFKNPQME